MDLNKSRVGFGMAVSDKTEARAFYEDTLGLSQRSGSDENWEYVCGEDTRFRIYVSPGSAGTSKATQVSWGVEDIEEAVEVLTARGVVFEQYHQGGIQTNPQGIATFEGGGRVAYFKDPDSNILSLAQAPT